MIVKVHQTPNGKMLAVCDSDILGKVFEEGEKQLDLSAQFYQGSEKTEEELETLIKDCYIINAVGKDSVGFLVKHNLIDKENIMTISDVPHAQAVIEH
jgi:hypothetical protein